MKIKLNYILLFLFICQLYSCNERDPDIYYVDLDAPMEKRLDDYIRNVELIPLETTEENLIKNITKVVLYNDLYYVKDIYEGVFVFNTTGHFVRRIGSKGSGPGEYGYISDFCINRCTGNIELLSPTGNIMIFSIDGIYMGMITYRSIEVSNFLLVDEDLILFFHQSQSPVMTLYSRKKQQVIRDYFEVPENFERRRPNYLISPPFYLVGRDTLVHFGYMNEVYTFRNKMIDYRYSFDFGRHNFNFNDYDWSLDMQKDYYRELLWAKESIAFGFYNHFENERYILKQVYYRKGNGIVLVDKKKGRNYFIQGFRNLYDPAGEDSPVAETTPATENGTRLGMILNWDSGSDDILTSVEPARKEQYINPGLLDSTSYAIYTSLKITDNPVLVKYKLKEE